MDFSVTSPESVGFSSSRLARIRPVMQSYVDQHGYAGISTMIARQGRPACLTMTGSITAFEFAFQKRNVTVTAL